MTIVGTATATIPIIDVGPCFAGAPGALESAAAELRRALEEVGFLVMVNSGDMMHRWTNGCFRSTPHRALPPVGRHRYAIPFFLGPHIDTVIECLPGCQGPGHPARFAPITYADYLTWWYDANYAASRQDDAR